jgi:MtN3 and saliva related transmembrane protein
MDFTAALGLIAGICTASSLIPQLVTTIQKKKASDVSMLMFVVLLVGNSLWIWYGIKKDDLPIIGTNIFSLLLNITMLILKFKFS